MTLRLAEFWVFIALALAIHLAFFLQMPRGGAEAGGAGGEDFVTILAATEQVETMVADWKRPPEVAAPAPRQPEPSLPVAFDPPPAPADLVALPELRQPEEISPVQPDRIAAIRQPPPPPDPERATELAPETTPMPKRRTVPPVAQAKTPDPVRTPPSPTATPGRKAQQASAGQAGQRAAGSGGGAQAGRGSQAVSTGVSKSQAASLKQVWGAKIRSRIERAKRYPSGRRQKARVGIALTVSAAGQLQGVSVTRSSGIAAFDQAAIQAVRRAGRFPSAPAGLPGNAHNFSVTLVFN
ncbi:TonB family protein [Tropicimonas sp.]|uniref:TonB family protein n=1 Tax=Tropicimonas sp. TaxID=2067044 RepID=UPI003A89E475